MRLDRERGETRHTIAMPSPASPGRDDVQVWYADVALLASDAGRLARAAARLPAAEHTRYRRFRHDVDRHMFLLGRLMARALVARAAGFAPDAWRWREGPHGRPEIDEPACPWRFNLAHSAGLVVCGLARSRDIGVDVEDLQRRPTDMDVVHRYCSADELDDIVRQPDDGWHERFLTYWTLKEAYLKALGLGISVHLADVAFDLTDARVCFVPGPSLAGSDTRWMFELARPTSRHLLAVAASCGDGATPRLVVQPFPAGWMPA